MDELVQFISASISDMTRADGRGNARAPPTTKQQQQQQPSSYKCTLLDERATSSAGPAPGHTCGPGAGPGGRQDDNSKDNVQQSQVSSTRSPSVLANDIIGPLLLEALDGFLFMVDHMGKIQFISENVTQYLKYTKDDLIGNNIYNLVHCDDYDHFTKSLDLLSKDSSSKNRTFTCRMNIKPPGEERDRCYDNMQITAILQPHPCDVESDKSATRCLLACIARRTGCVEKCPTSLGIEKFTTKQDLKGKILACDTSGGQKNGNHSYSKLIGENVQDFCHMNDRQQLLKHHREVISNGSNTSCVYRFRLHENRYVFVQTKSKLFKSPLNGNPEFIMSTHSIIRECDTESELKGTASSCLMKAIIGSSGSRLSKDQNVLNAVRPLPALAQPQSTIFDLDDFLNDPRLGFDGIADESSFSDIPDLLPNSTKCTSLSNLSLDKSFTSCPESPMSSMSSIPSLSPATSVSRSPRSSSTAIQQSGWTTKEYRAPKQGRGRPRSVRKSVANEQLASWMPSPMGVVGSMSTIQHGQVLSGISPVKQSDLKGRRTFNNPRSVGSFHSPVPTLPDSWENIYSSPSSLEPLSSQFPKKTGFGEISLIQQMCQLQKGNRQRSFSGSSGASSSLLDKYTSNTRGGNKNAHLLDLLMRDDDEDEETSSCMYSPPVSRENVSVRSATASVKSDHSDSEVATAGLNPPGEQAKDDGSEGTTAKKPANQNAILKKLLSQADEDSQPFQCDLKLAPFDVDVGRDKTAQVTLADSSAAQTISSTDSSTTSASNEAEPKSTDDALLKQLLNKDDTCLPVRSSSPELLKSLLASEETFAQLGEVNSSETEVAPSGLSSPTAMEVSLSEQLNEFLSSGVKRKALDLDDSGDCTRRIKVSSRGSSVNEEIGKVQYGQYNSGVPTGPSKRNILLAQLLSKQVENESLVGMKDLSAIATVTPLMQMLQQCGGSVSSKNVKVDDGSFPRKQDGDDFSGKNDPDDASGCIVPDLPSGMLLDSEMQAALQCPKLKKENEETVGDDAQLQKPLGLDDDSNWEDFPGFCNMEKGDNPAHKDLESSKVTSGKNLENLQDDLPKNDVGSPSEEDKKILAELEEVLESSKFTMEDLNSIFILSSTLALEPTNKVTTKSAINALEEQVSRIDSDLNPQSGMIEGQDAINARCQMTGNNRWTNMGGGGGEMNEMGMLNDFGDLMTAPGAQKYSSQMQGYPKRNAAESTAAVNSLHLSNMFDPSLSMSTPARHHDVHHQQMFPQGQLHVNTDLPPRSNRLEQGSDVHSGNREALFGEYTPISPALQDNVFSSNETFSFGGDPMPRSGSTAANYNMTGMNNAFAMGHQGSCSPSISGRCHSGQLNQFGQSDQFYGGNTRMDMRDAAERKRSGGYAERFNPLLNHSMHTPMNDPVAEHGMYMNSSHRNFDPMNRGGWNPMSAGHLDGSMMVDQRSAGQFNQTHMSLMNGSHMNELPKTSSPFYGHGQGRSMFKGRAKMNVNRMDAGHVNQMNMNQMDGNHMNQMNISQMNHNSIPHMNPSQINMMNVNQMNQLNVNHVNQINVGQVDQLNFGSMNPLNMGQLNVGQMNMGQTNIGQMNIGQMNMGQMCRGNSFMSKGSSSNEFSNKMNKAFLGSMDVGAMDHLQSRSNGHLSQADFMVANPSQGMECSPMRGGQRMSRKMNSLDMSLDPVGVLGYGDSRVGEQMQSLQGNMNHLGMNSMNGPLGRSTGGLRQCVDQVNQSAVNGGQVNRALQMNHAGQLHHGKLTAANHGFGRSMDQSGFGPPNLGQSVIGQPGMGQPYGGQPNVGQPSMNKVPVGPSTPVDQPILDRISQMGIPSSGFGSPPELSMEEIFQSKNACNSKLHGSGSARGGGGSAGGGGTPSLFGGADGKMYGYRMSEHHSLQQQQTSQQQLNTQYSNCTDAMLLSPISNQSSIGMETGSANKTPTPNSCIGFAGRISSGRDAGKSMQRNALEGNTSKDTSTREYIKQELRNMCTARAQGQSHQQQQQQQQQQLPGNQLSPVEHSALQGFASDELPLDILESINEITRAQEKQKLLEGQKDGSGSHQKPFNGSSVLSKRQPEKIGDPLFFTGENNENPLGGDQFWESLSNEELAEAQQQALSFEDGLFDPALDSTHVLPKIPLNQVRMMSKSGSILQKLLSDTT